MEDEALGSPRDWKKGMPLFEETGYIGIKGRMYISSSFTE